MGVEEQVWKDAGVTGLQRYTGRISVVVGDLKEGVDGVLQSAERPLHQFSGHPQQTAVLDLGITIELADGKKIKGVSGESRVNHVGQGKDYNSA